MSKKKLSMKLTLTFIWVLTQHIYASYNDPYKQDYYFQQAKYFAERSDTKTAIDCYKKVIATNPHHFLALFNCANLLLQTNCLHESYELYQKASELQPDCPEIYFNIGIICQMSGEIDNAIQYYKKAFEKNPEYLKALIQLGTCLKNEHLFDQALKYFYKILDIQPNNPIAHHNIAQIYYDTEKFDEAIYHFGRTIQYDNNNDIINDYAGVLNLIHNYKKAISLYEKLLKRYPNSAEVHYNIANSLKRQKRLGEAFFFYEKALELNPNSAFLQFGMGLAHLTAGQFKEGWEKYEFRWEAHNIPKAQFSKPMWDGSSLEGKILFLHAEQGLGDTFQFIRYAQVAKQAGATVIAAVQNPLMALLSLCPFIDQVYDKSYVPEQFDYHCPLMSMPFLCKTTIETIPCPIPYLYADPHLIDHWATILQKDINFKIGICWQGNKNFKTKALKFLFKSREVELKQFEPLVSIDHVSLYSLQKIIGEEQIKTIKHTGNFKIFTGDFDNSHGRFMDTAAVIKNLDLVITVDTSIAHLAGALGVPVWVLIPEPPDYRWMLDIPYSPWYPTMKLFRQKTPGNWEDVMQKVTKELGNLLNTKYCSKQI